MDMDIDALLKEVLGKMMREKKGAGDEVREDWIQVAKLSPEEIGLLRSWRARAREDKNEIELLFKKIELIQTKIEVSKREWWNKVEKKHGLCGKKLHVRDADFAILQMPEDKEEKDHDCI